MNTIENEKVEEVKTNFREAMSSALKTQSVSKKELATHIGVSVNTIRNILSGENFNFKVAILVDLALSLDFFADNTGPMTVESTTEEYTLDSHTA